MYIYTWHVFAHVSSLTPKKLYNDLLMYVHVQKALKFYEQFSIKVIIVIKLLFFILGVFSYIVNNRNEQLSLYLDPEPRILKLLISFF